MWEERGFDGGDVEQVISFTIVENPNITDLQHEAVKGAPFQDPEVSPDLRTYIYSSDHYYVGTSSKDIGKFSIRQKSIRDP